MKKCMATVAITILMLTLISGGSKLQAQNPEQQVKMVFIYNFTRYIEWPQQQTELIIGIYGSDQAILNAFLDMASKKSTNSRKIIIKNLTTASEAGKCDIVFIPAQNSNSLAALKSTGLQNTLIITEKPGMAEQGSSINFVTVDGKVRFEINKDEIERSGLKISSQLLGLAIEV